MAEGLPPNHEMNPMRAMQMVPKRPPPTLTDPKKWSKDFNDFIARSLTKGSLQPTKQQTVGKHNLTATVPLSTLFLFTLPTLSFYSLDPEQRPDCLELLTHPFIRSSKGSSAVKERLNECFIQKLKQQALKVMHWRGLGYPI